MGDADHQRRRLTAARPELSELHDHLFAALHDVAKTRKAKNSKDQLSRAFSKNCFRACRRLQTSTSFLEIKSQPVCREMRERFSMMGNRDPRPPRRIAVLLAYKSGVRLAAE